MSKKRKQQSRRPTAGWRGRGRDAGRRADGAGPSAHGPPRGDHAAAAEVVELLARLGAGPVGASRHEVLRRLADLPREVVTGAARPVIEAFLAGAWARGWQPVELVWHIRRSTSAGAEGLATAGVRADAARLNVGAVHPRWADQLADLGAEVAAGPAEVDAAWLQAATEPIADPLAALCDLVLALTLLPTLQVLLPVPGRPDIALDVVAAGDDDRAEGIDPKVLAKVRALLAKAEATSFEAEAQAFTAKAHELMTRHSLEHAHLSSGRADGGNRAVALRLLIDDPYAAAKSVLVHVVAEASRCRSVFASHLHMATVVGHPSDLAAVEVLYTSLLVQAQTGLQDLAGRTESGSRERSRGFRSAFLEGFAGRIGQRLEATGAAAVGDLDRQSGGALVPVLAEREVDVDDQVARLFPHLRSRSRRRSVDGLGYRAGAAAAERADLPFAQVTS